MRKALEIYFLILFTQNINGEMVRVIHLGKGVSIRETDHMNIQDALRDAWPREYGKNAPGSKTLQGRRHTEAFQALMEAIWPEKTYLSFQRSRNKLRVRPPFHDERLVVAESEF